MVTTTDYSQTGNILFARLLLNCGLAFILQKIYKDKERDIALGPSKSPRFRQNLLPVGASSSCLPCEGYALKRKHTTPANLKHGKNLEEASKS